LNAAAPRSEVQDAAGGDSFAEIGFTLGLRAAALVQSAAGLRAERSF